MVSVFLEAVPANRLAAEAVCNDNRANNATYTRFGMMIRIRGDGRLVLKRGVIEEAIRRGLTENEWRSVTWLYIGSISKFEENEAVFDDSEESKVVDRYWDDQLESIKGKVGNLKSG